MIKDKKLGGKILLILKVRCVDIFFYIVNLENIVKKE